MKVLIIGAGGVGLGLAGCLIESGCTTGIVARGDTYEKLTTDGFEWNGIFGARRCASRDFHTWPSVREIDVHDFDVILVCTKSFDTERAARDLVSVPRVSGGNTRIVSCQNGYGNVETLFSLFPRDRVFAARIITGFRKSAPNSVEITVHAAPIHIGHFDPGLSDSMHGLCEKIHSGGIPSEVSDTIEQDLWAKLLYNALLNPLGAILGVPYGALGESTHARGIMRTIAEEAFTVMSASGTKTHWASPGPFLDAFYSSMLPPTAKHESSMLQDIRAGKRTEIDALNGALARLGITHGVKVPVNQAIAGMIRFMEQSRQHTKI